MSQCKIARLVVCVPTAALMQQTSRQHVENSELHGVGQEEEEETDLHSATQIGFTDVPGLSVC